MPSPSADAILGRQADELREDVALLEVLFACRRIWFPSVGKAKGIRALLKNYLAMKQPSDITGYAMKAISR